MLKLLPLSACLLLVVAVSGCDAAQPDAATPAQQSKYAIDHFFKDPKAQALAVAAEQGNVAEVQRLMKQEHVNPDVVFSDDDSGMPLVAWPVFTHSLAGLSAMLDGGANPNIRKPGHTLRRFEDGSVSDHFNFDNAMVWAAKQDDPGYLSLLLDHGGDPNTRNANGETLLFQAYIWHDQWRNVQLLVERGADVNAISQGGTVLYDYSSLGGFEQAYWLLDHGADPRAGALAQSPELPRYMAVEAMFWHPANASDTSWQRKCQQWLLAHGYTRPPMPDSYRGMRKNLGLPYEEKDVPLL